MEAFRVVERAIEAGPIPGAAAAVDEQSACVGATEPGGPAVSGDTWYDLASLTKVLCTVPLLLERIAEGRLDPSAPLRELLPETAWLQPSPSLADARPIELATHTSGLAAWEPLYTLGRDRATLLAGLLQAPIGDTRGQILYSDLGYILLGHLLERRGGTPLEEQAAALYARLGLADQLAFRVAPERCAPTEHCPWRGRVLRGEVHDENAAALGGVSGHAGLFGTLAGVVGFARALVERRLCPEPVLAYLAREHARGADGERRGFGWVLAHPGWSGGDLAGPRTIGHTGFTGTGLWIDLDRGRRTVLLTNRVHPSRHVDSGIVRLRRAFNHAAFAQP
ncbi:MAG TPA: serine hydrolase domain-containing protein [Chloroflexota bacterium]